MYDDPDRMQQKQAVEWLNRKKDEKPQSASYKRVRSTINSLEKLIRLDAARNYPSATLLLPGNKRTKSKSTARQRQNLQLRLELIRRITRILRRHVIGIGFSPDRFKLEIFRLRMTDFAERDVTCVILNLAMQDRSGGVWFSPLRQCDHCHNWSLQPRSRQRFCTRRCRQAHHSQSPEFKEKRRKYMAKYRQKERSDDQESLRRVKQG